VPERVLGADGLAAHDHLQRLLHAHQARQPLGAARAGQEAEPPREYSEARRSGRHPVVAGQGHLEVDMDRGAMEGSDHGLGGALDQVEDFVNPGRSGRLAELGLVAATDER